FVAWIDATNYSATDEDVYLQHVMASGVIAPGWPPSGAAVAALPQRQAPDDIVPDGQGGALVVWEDGRFIPGTGPDIYAQRTLADGSLPPGWPSNGVPVTRAPGTQDFAVIASDFAGGAYVAWRDWRDLSTQSTDLYA